MSASRIKKERTRQPERDRLMNPECSSTKVRLEAVGVGVKVQVEGDILRRGN